MHNPNKEKRGTKILSLLVVVSLLFSNFVFPQQTHAQLATFDVGLNPLFNTVVAPSTAQTAANTASLVTKELVLDGIAWAAAKVIIQNMLQSVVAWARNGFNGGPAFVQNPEAFLRQVGDQTAGLIIEDIAPFLCEPFRLSVQLGLELSYSLPVFDRIDCTLSEVIGNIDGFLDGDFTQGGLDGLFSLTQNPGNNPYGATLLAQAELQSQVGRRQGTELSLLGFGNGFFSSKDAEGNVITPGRVIEDQVNQAVGSPTRQLEIADEIDEVIAVVISSLVTQVLSNGL